MLVGHKRVLNSVPPTTPALTHRNMSVSKDGCGVRMCWRMIFSPCIWGQIKLCELCERYICWGVKYYFAILPPPHPCQSSSLSFCNSHSVALCLSALWKWKIELVIHSSTCGASEREWQFCLNDLDFFSPFSLFFLPGFCFFPQPSLFLISFSYHSLSESWCRCWRGIWMCPAEVNSVSPSSEPLKPSSTSSSSSSAHACSTLSECLWTDHYDYDWLLISFWTYNDANRDPWTRTEPSDTAGVIDFDSSVRKGCWLKH